MPTTPQKDAGCLIDPPVSVPKEKHAAEAAIIPSMIWGYVEDDDEFYSAVENWFKETYPDEDFG